MLIDSKNLKIVDFGFDAVADEALRVLTRKIARETAAAIKRKEEETTNKSEEEMGEAPLSEEEEEEEDTQRHTTGSIAELLTNCRWALMDVVTIQTSPADQRVRKLCILADGVYANTKMEEEFYPCA